MTGTRKKSAQSYQEGISSFVDKQREEREEEKKNDLEDAKFWSRKTNPTIASWITGVSKDEIRDMKKKPEPVKKEEPKIVKKKSEPVKEDKCDIEKELIMKDKCRKLVDVDLDYYRNEKIQAALGVTKEQYRKKYFTNQEILEITDYQKKQNKIKNPSFWSSPVDTLTKAFKKKPTSEERHRKAKEIKDHYTERYGLRKK